VPSFFFLSSFLPSFLHTIYHFFCSLCSFFFTTPFSSSFSPLLPCDTPLCASGPFAPLLHAPAVVPDMSDLRHVPPSDGSQPDAHDANVARDSNSSRASSWDVVNGDESADNAAPSNSPHVSLFGAAQAGPSLSQPASRSLSVLASATNMTRRPARLTVSDEQPPIAQLNTQIPSAQKAVDDPTTPLDSSRRSGESRRHEYAPLTLSRLFAGDATMSSSRTPSYNQASGPLYLRASFEAVPLPDHLYARGLLEGRHSDITVIAFRKKYNLHRLLLDRAPFFTTALSEPWIESQSKEVALYPEEIDTHITQAAFELAIKKLYGVDITKETDGEAIGLFATGCWLEMQDLIDASIESILRQMSPENLVPLIRLVTLNYYGRSGERILESAKAMLSRSGWEMPLRYWDHMPGDIIRELVGSDGFFIDSEWDRWVLVKRLLDRRLKLTAIDAGLIKRGTKPVPKAPTSLSFMAVRFDSVYRQNAMTLSKPMSDEDSPWVALYTNPDIERILVLLDEGIHYVHMDYEQLDAIRTSRDVFGLPILPEKVISDALWRQLALRQTVLAANDSAQELGLCKALSEPATAVTMPSSKGKQKASASIEDKDSEQESGSWDGNGRPRKFWIPSSDCNIVLGNGADPVVTTSNSFQRHASRLSATLQPEDAQWATDFASSPSTMANPNTRTDYPARPVSAGGSNAGQPQPFAYTEYPPFRFSAEFPNPRFLKEKKRVYSRTVSYAGSLWNIYIQKVRSAKNVQLGVYLHRAKEREGEEQPPGNSLTQQNAGSVDERIGQFEHDMLQRRERRRSNRVTADQTGDEDGSGSGGDADATLMSTGSRNPLFSINNLGRYRDSVDSDVSTGSRNEPDSACFPVALFDTSDVDSDDSEEEEPLHAYPNPSSAPLNSRKSQSSMPTLPPYVDKRPTIKTYFKIYSPSKGGRMLSIYESAPDRFNFSQSWGWKSSTLMLDEVALIGGGDDDAGAAKKSSDGKLRFVVVIGNL
jgi:hypothetical protein